MPYGCNPLASSSDTTSGKVRYMVVIEVLAFDWSCAILIAAAAAHVLVREDMVRAQVRIGRSISCVLSVTM